MDPTSLVYYGNFGISSRVIDCSVGYLDAVADFCLDKTYVIEYRTSIIGISSIAS